MSNLQKITDDAALAEAIKHAMAVAAEKACTPCGQEHDALADWLMELQRTRYATAEFLRAQLFWEDGRPATDEGCKIYGLKCPSCGVFHRTNS